MPTVPSRAMRREAARPGAGDRARERTPTPPPARRPELESSASDEELDKLIATTERYCVVLQTLVNTPDLEVVRTRSAGLDGGLPAFRMRKRLCGHGERCFCAS